MNTEIQRARTYLRDKSYERRLSTTDHRLGYVLAEATQMEMDLQWATDIMVATLEQDILHEALRKQILGFLSRQGEGGNYER